MLYAISNWLGGLWNVIGRFDSGVTSGLKIERHRLSTDRCAIVRIWNAWYLV